MITIFAQQPKLQCQGRGGPCNSHHVCIETLGSLVHICMIVFSSQKISSFSSREKSCCKMTEQEDTIINALFVSVNGTSMSYYVTKAAMDKY